MGDKPTLASHLRALLSGTTRRTTVGELRKQGYRRVGVIGADQLARLVEVAVERALAERGVEGDEGLRGEVGRRAESLVREVARLEAERDAARREGTELERQVDELRREFARAQSRLGDARRAARVEEALRPSPERGGLRDRVRGILDAGGDPSSVAARIAEEVEAFLATAAPASGVGAETAALVERLERRMRRVEEALRRAEEALTAAGVEVPPGISSIYRDPQGLSPGALHYERKRALLERLLEENLRLQKGFGGPTRPLAAS